MKNLDLNLVKHVVGGDAAATRAPGTNSWGEIVDDRAWMAAKCQADGVFSWSCFGYAMKYGSSF